MKSNKINRIYFGGDLSYKEIILFFFSKNISFIEVDDIKNADIIYWIYGKGPALNFKNLNIWISNKKKIIVHWIGTDVTTHLTKVKKNKKIKSRIYHKIWTYLICRKIKKGSMLNFCCAEWLCEELAETKIKSHYLPLTTLRKELFSFKESNRTIDFISYWFQKRIDEYNGELIFKIARKMSNYKFAVIIPDIIKRSELEINNIPENLTIMPRTDFSKMNEIYRNSKCFLRFPIHDGLSLSVLESIANRLQVFWTYKFPNVIKVELNDEDLLVQNLSTVIENWQPNYEGQNKVLKDFDLEEIVKIFSYHFSNFYDYNH